MERKGEREICDVKEEGRKDKAKGMPTLHSGEGKKRRGKREERRDKRGQWRSTHEERGERRGRKREDREKRGRNLETYQTGRDVTRSATLMTKMLGNSTNAGCGVKFGASQKEERIVFGPD